MTKLSVSLEGDGCWPDVDIDKVRTLNLDRIALLPDGTKAGAPSVSLLLTDPQNGNQFYAQTTFKLLQAAVQAMAERVGQ